jgi:hypothetical protein
MYAWRFGRIDLLSLQESYLDLIRKNPNNRLCRIDSPQKFSAAMAIVEHPAISKPMPPLFQAP